MITLTGTLEAAQRAASTKPYVEAYVDNRPVEVPRLEWTQVYVDGSADCNSAAVVASDGSIVRARARPTGLGTTELWLQRITDPTVGAQWTSWGAAVATISTADQVVALQVDTGVAGRMRVYYIHAGDHEVRCKVSDDDGATWGAPATIVNWGAAIVRGIAAEGQCPGGWVVYGVDPLGADPDDYLVASWWDGAAWQSFADMVKKWSLIHSLGMGYRASDATLFVMVAAGAPREFLGRLYEIGVGWTGDSPPMYTPGSGSGYTLSFPYLRVPTAAEPRYALVYHENYLGLGSNKLTRICWSWDGYRMLNEIPVNIDATRGVCLIKRAEDSQWYLVGSKEAWKAPVYAAGDRVDVSADVVAYDMDDYGGMLAGGGMKAGKLALLLDNSDGAYQNAGVSGTYKWIREGSQVAIKQGYAGTAGNEAVWASPWWIDRVAFEDVMGEGYLRLDCVDAWGMMERLASRRQMTFVGQTLNLILVRLLWSVCGFEEVVLHANLNVTVPTFTWGPGESLAHVARRVLDMSGLWLRFKTVQGSANGSGWDSVGVDVVELGSGGSEYSYGPSGHKVMRGRYGVSGQRLNDFAVLGKFDESFKVDWSAVESVGRSYFKRVVDKHLDTAGKVDSRADYLNYAADVGIERGYVDVVSNVGQQVGDVVDVTDSRAGLAAAPLRVGAISTVLERRKRGKFAQRMVLVGV